MKLDVVRSKVGFQAPNKEFGVGRMMDAKPDWVVIMQDTEPMYLGEILARNPNAFVNLRWYDDDSLARDPATIAANATGWIFGKREDGVWKPGVVERYALRPNQWCLQLSNEQNIGAEHANREDLHTAEDYIRWARWEYEAISWARNGRPEFLISSPHLSPGHSEDQPDKGYVAFELPEVRKAIESADIFGGHYYWNRDAAGRPWGLDGDEHAGYWFQRWRKHHEYFPKMPMLITESNGNYRITDLPNREEKLRALQESVRALRLVEAEPYIMGICFFIWWSDGHPTYYSDETVEVFSTLERRVSAFEWPRPEPEVVEEGDPVAYTREQVIEIICGVAEEKGVKPALALAIADMESGLNPLAAGDYEAGMPHSIGLYQLHDRGQGANMTREQREDPRANAEKALGTLGARINSYGEIAAIGMHNAGENGWQDQATQQVVMARYVLPVLGLADKWGKYLEEHAVAEDVPADFYGPDWFAKAGDRGKWLIHAEAIKTIGAERAKRHELELHVGEVEAIVENLQGKLDAIAEIVA